MIDPPDASGRARRHFRYNTDIGQNFLKDQSVVDWMIDQAKPQPSDRVLEIGPGRGILTRGILSSSCASLDAVEIDTRLKADLEPIAASDKRLSLHWGDAVRFDYRSLDPSPTHVIANLPYHITTPLIWRLLESLAGHGTRYMLLMTQHEAALRITSGGPGRESCPLGVTIAASGSAALLRRVPRHAFIPVPRVDSSIIELKLSVGDGADLRQDLARDVIWRRLLSGSFARRRRTLANNWAASFGAAREKTCEILTAHSIAPLSRSEDLSPDMWLQLRADSDVREMIKV
ncbi:MAG: 16S rRNA (adenine(1518)-N(6)/adenine(1519)-N(6))-dimethyltransferase RsmA [Synergistaceae bacterium]|jgi:16S rRNA (adenine1518-N6/adenine1519-N6)-dimethyltransferase|nr:16S rRNA (adenine(1518)-N(6)/adenine(1519)-N(6))-dimethyltransferase RsmA [Synergistaceae bacterium]